VIFFRITVPGLADAAASDRGGADSASYVAALVTLPVLVTVLRVGYLVVRHRRERIVQRAFLSGWTFFIAGLLAWMEIASANSPS
jgi:hypothetical protein